jgi:15-cis-phytoene synthase
VARDTSFSYSFLVLPADQRLAIGVVWDFCRAVDDAVDHASDRAAAASEIDEWRREVDRLFSGANPRRAELADLKSTIERFALSRQPFDDLIDGVEMDLHRSRYETFDDLLSYCRRVASAVGLICVEIFGCRDSDAREYAVNLGLALQLTNIIRDVAVDLKIGRVYLPKEDLERFGVDEETLKAGRVTPGVRALLDFESQRARQLYAAAARALPAAEAGRLIAAEIMGAIYFEILQRIERQDYDVFSSVIRVPKPVRAMIALTTWARYQLFSFGVRSSARA